MKINGGKIRGMSLLTPKNMETRPMLDKAKQAIFNILGERIDGAFVLDLFAGTGSLGLESLSRGASECYFVENGFSILPILEANIQKARFNEQSRILRMDAFSVIKALGEKKFHLFFLDPPYRCIDNPTERRVCLEFAARLCASAAHKNFCMVLHYRRGSMAGFPMPVGLRTSDIRTYGTTELMFIEAPVV